MKQGCDINTFVCKKGFVRLPRRHKESWAFCCSVRRDTRKHRLPQDYRRGAGSDATEAAK